MDYYNKMLYEKALEILGELKDEDFTSKQIKEIVECILDLAQA